ncbi:MAG TPA: hypothetical protein VGG92_08195 [Caulobacteraceae bacterium]|jgi:hypothetical protein
MRARLSVSQQGIERQPRNQADGVGQLDGAVGLENRPAGRLLKYRSFRRPRRDRQQRATVGVKATLQAAAAPPHYDGLAGTGVALGPTVDDGRQAARGKMIGIQRALGRPSADRRDDQIAVEQVDVRRQVLPSHRERLDTVAVPGLKDVYSNEAVDTGSAYSSYIKATHVGFTIAKISCADGIYAKDFSTGDAFLLAQDYCRRALAIKAGQDALESYVQSLAHAKTTLNDMVAGKDNLKDKDLVKALQKDISTLRDDVSTLKKAFG